MEEYRPYMSDRQLISTPTSEEEIEKLPPAVKAHTPNQVFTFSDGREYTVNRDGSWIKTKEELKGGKRVKANR